MAQTPKHQTNAGETPRSSASRLSARARVVIDTDAGADAGVARAYELRAGQALAGCADHLAGSRMALALFVKGAPGPAEKRGGAPFSGADGQALAKALPRLGFEREEAAGLLVALPEGAALSASQLLDVVLAVDPLVLVTLDAQGRDATAAALGMDEPPAYGTPVRAWCGCEVVAVEEFEAALGSQEAKRVAWAQLKCATRPGEPF